MKSIIVTAIAVVMVFTGCQDYENEPQASSRLETLLADFKESDVYQDFNHWKIQLNLEESELVEITQIEYLFIPAKESSGNELTYVAKWLPQEGWAHFLSIDLEGEFDRKRQFNGEIAFDFYSRGIYSRHTFTDGIQEDYQIFSHNQDTMRRTILGRNTATEECESMCHVLDCTGKKFEEKHWLSQLECASSILPCLASLAIQCLDEGCANSWVESCDHH